MRAPKRALVGERAAFERARDRSDHRHFEKLGRRKRRQDRWQPCRQHRLAGAGRPDHQHGIYSMTIESLIARGIRAHYQEPPMTAVPRPKAYSYIRFSTP